MLFRLVQPTLRCTVAAAAGIPVRFAHSNVVGNLTVPPQTPRAYGTNRLTPAAAAGIPLAVASLKCGREPTVPPTNAPLPDRFYEGFPGIAKELLAARRGKFLYV